MLKKPWKFQGLKPSLLVPTSWIKAKMMKQVWLQLPSGPWDASVVVFVVIVVLVLVLVTIIFYVVSFVSFLFVSLLWNAFGLSRRKVMSAKNGLIKHDGVLTIDAFSLPTTSYARYFSWTLLKNCGLGRKGEQSVISLSVNKQKIIVCFMQFNLFILHAHGRK